MLLVFLYFVYSLQSNVQLGLDFLSPESVGEAARMAADIRCLPNDHEAKLQVLEVRDKDRFEFNLFSFNLIWSIYIF